MGENGKGTGEDGEDGKGDTRRRFCADELADGGLLVDEWKKTGTTAGVAKTISRTQSAEQPGFLRAPCPRKRRASLKPYHGAAAG